MGLKDAEATSHKQKDLTQNGDTNLCEMNKLTPELKAELKAIIQETVDHVLERRIDNFLKNYIAFPDAEILVEAIRQTLGEFNLFGNNHEPRSKWPKYILKCEKALELYRSRGGEKEK